MHYFVFPPWAHFSFAWSDLPELVLTPENYKLEQRGESVSRMVSLGYRVERTGQEFFSGPDGGGIIRVTQSFATWFPAVLLRTECSFETPPGFPRSINYGVNVIVPKLSAEHRLHLKPMPPAPSPFFSVEPIEVRGSYCFIAFGLKKKCGRIVNLPEAFDSLGVRIIQLRQMPDIAGNSFSKIVNIRWVYEWYEVAASYPLDVRVAMALFVYLGLALCGKMNKGVVTAHLFSPDFVTGNEYPSAAKWTNKPTGAKGTADQW